MRAKVLRSELKESMAVATKIAAVKSPMAILEGVKIEAKDDMVHLYVTDMENSAHIQMPAEVEEEGALLVSSKLMMNLVSKLDSPEVWLEGDENKLVIATETFRGELATYPLEEFPQIMFEEPQKRVGLPADELNDLIEKVAFASSYPDDTNPVFAGVLVEIEGDKLSFVATDGSQLAKREVSLPEDVGEYKGIVPTKSLLAISKLLKGLGEVSLELGDTSFGIEFKGIHISSRLIEGEFPEYREVIPQEFNTEIKLSGKALNSALKRIILLSKTKGLEGIVTFQIEEEQLVIKSLESELGRAEERIPLLSFNGDPQTIAFNGKIVLQALSKTKFDLITLKFIDDMSPMTLVTEEDEGYLYLLMPVRVGVEV